MSEENFGFWKNLILVSIFFFITPITLAVSLFSLLSLKSNSQLPKAPQIGNIILTPQTGVQVYASLPTKLPEVSDLIGVEDARPALIHQYLERYSSPLTPYSNLIVSAADQYSLDFRLITAIAQQESNLCKVIPPGSYNCWGWGITGSGTLGFSSYEDGIKKVSVGLRNEYLGKGYKTVEDIMGKYTPLSNGSWAKGVTEFMDEMQ